MRSLREPASGGSSSSGINTNTMNASTNDRSPRVAKSTRCNMKDPNAASASSISSSSAVESSLRAKLRQTKSSLAFTQTLYRQLRDHCVTIGVVPPPPLLVKTSLSTRNAIGNGKGNGNSRSKKINQISECIVDGDQLRIIRPAKPLTLATGNMNSKSSNVTTASRSYEEEVKRQSDQSDDSDGHYNDYDYASDDDDIDVDIDNDNTHDDGDGNGGNKVFNADELGGSGPPSELPSRGVTPRDAARAIASIPTLNLNLVSPFVPATLQSSGYTLSTVGTQPTISTTSVAVAPPQSSSHHLSNNSNMLMTDELSPRRARLRNLNHALTTIDPFAAFATDGALMMTATGQLPLPNHDSPSLPVTPISQALTIAAAAHRSPIAAPTGVAAAPSSSSSARHRPINGSHRTKVLSSNGNTNELDMKSSPYSLPMPWVEPGSNVIQSVTPSPTFNANPSLLMASPIISPRISRTGMHVCSSRLSLLA
jgi:hypothetical protein